MQHKRLFGFSWFRFAAAPGAADAFMTLYRIRRTAFRLQSMALYRRYGQALMLFLALFGILLRERPDLLAAPLLHFWRAPGTLPADLAWGAAWMALVGAWTSIHRPFIRGGALARYSRSLPLARHTARLVDLSILGLSLPVFLVPFGVALWVAARSPQMLGADGRFALYLLLFGALTLATAQAVAFGPSLRARLGAGGVLGALVAAPWLPALALPLLAAAALAATVFACMGEAAMAQAGNKRTALSLLPILLRVQAGLLWHRHRHDAALRLLLAGLPQLAAWWMIVYAGKVEEARAFLQVGCAMTAAIASSYFHTLHLAGQGLRPYLDSMPFGRLRMALAAQALVLGVFALVFGASFAALAWTFGARHAVALDMAAAGAYWLAWLAPLGLPLFQHHKNGNLFKFALVTAALIIAFHS